MLDAGCYFCWDLVSLGSLVNNWGLKHRRVEFRKVCQIFAWKQVPDASRDGVLELAQLWIQVVSLRRLVVTVGCYS